MRNSVPIFTTGFVMMGYGDFEQKKHLIGQYGNTLFTYSGNEIYEIIISA